MACHPDKMTEVERAEAALAAHKAGHAAKQAEFCDRTFGCVLTYKSGRPVMDGGDVKKYSFTWAFATNVVLTGKKKFPQKVVNEVRKQIEANNEEYAIWRAESDAKLAELEAALEAAKAEEEIFVPEEVLPEEAPHAALMEALISVGYVPARGEDGDDDGRPMPRTTTRYPAEELKAVKVEETKKTPFAALMADMRPWADIADDEEERENAMLKRTFALTTPGKSYAFAARA